MLVEKDHTNESIDDAVCLFPRAASSTACSVNHAGDAA
jgi:hypothetical protein